MVLPGKAARLNFRWEERVADPWKQGQGLISLSFFLFSPFPITVAWNKSDLATD